MSIGIAGHVCTLCVLGHVYTLGVVGHVYSLGVGGISIVYVNWDMSIV
jgi:hypothetical protein